MSRVRVGAGRRRSVRLRSGPCAVHCVSSRSLPAGGDGGKAAKCFDLLVALPDEQVEAGAVALELSEGVEHRCRLACCGVQAGLDLRGGFVEVPGALP